MSRSLAKYARDVVLGLLLVVPASSKDELKHAVRATATLKPVMLHEPSAAPLADHAGPGRQILEMNVTVPFTGDPHLFRCSAPVWPSAREVKGTVGHAALILNIEGWTGNEPWLATVAGPELCEIKRIIAAQAIVLKQFDKELSASIDALIERVFPASTSANSPASTYRCCSLVIPGLQSWSTRLCRKIAPCCGESGAGDVTVSSQRRNNGSSSSEPG